MRRNWKIPITVLLASIITVLVTYRILESPNYVLRHALGLERLPSSITNLQMGSDVWTDEVRGFYFEISPEDFPALLAGRQFRRIDLGVPFEARTIHISPPVTFVAERHYRWRAENTRCEIITNDKKARVIAVFSAD